MVVVELVEDLVGRRALVAGAVAVGSPSCMLLLYSKTAFDEQAVFPTI